jgi:hypothetical protein
MKSSVNTVFSTMPALSMYLFTPMRLPLTLRMCLPAAAASPRIAMPAAAATAAAAVALPASPSLTVKSPPYPETQEVFDDLRLFRRELQDAQEKLYTDEEYYDMPMRALDTQHKCMGQTIHAIEYLLYVSGEEIENTQPMTTSPYIYVRNQEVFDKLRIYREELVQEGLHTEKIIDAIDNLLST